ncbi:adenylyl-sulfate kinase [Desulfonauticus submarinus]|uniref:Adenylylsulfate kinase n=1 Tax=Desulfonauticus submarinus TaxID=206665 RepID=A0A1H0CR62_9BACT|nr:adenylyl-sulfate kinase [Desulfonauticus submarinus]SDN60348.1 adenylylsulfate kinase [Desulfonauticus submarinus]
MKGWIIWFVGLPGSGKSSLSKAAFKFLQKFCSQDIVYLEMDVKRKEYFPNPTYTKEERELAYKMFGDEGIDLAKQGKGVILDGAAYKLEFRDRVRRKFNPFAEIYIKCSLEIAMQREANRPEGKIMANLYAKALERKKTGKIFPGLGEVIGVDVDFEENPNADFILENDRLSLEEAEKEVIFFIKKWLERNNLQ